MPWNAAELEENITEEDKFSKQNRGYPNLIVFHEINSQWQGVGSTGCPLRIKGQQSLECMLRADSQVKFKC